MSSWETPGSQLIGLVLATLGLMASYKEAGTTIATLVLPLLILAVPILDTTLVTTLRLRSGRSVTQGGRDHTSHRLVYRGLSERRAVFFLVAVSAALGLTSLAYAVLDSGRITTIGVLVTFALLLQFAAFLSDVAAAPGETGLSDRAGLLVDTLVDGALTAAALYAAYVIVIEGNGTEIQRHIFIWALPAVIFCRYIALFVFGLYRRDRHYSKSATLARIGAAVATSEIVAYLFVTNTQPTDQIPELDLRSRRDHLLRAPRRRPVRRACRAPSDPFVEAAEHDRTGLMSDGSSTTPRVSTGDRLLGATPLAVRRSWSSRASTSGRRPEAPDAVALLGRDRVRADLARDRGDRYAGTPWRRVLGRRALPVADRAVLVVRQPADRLQRSQDVQRPRDDGGDLPDVRARPDADAAAVRTPRRRRRRRRSVVHLLGDGHAGAGRVSDRRCELLRGGARALVPDAMEHRRRRRSRPRGSVRSRPVDPRACSDDRRHRRAVRLLRGRPSRARQSFDGRGGSGLRSLVVAALALMVLAARVASGEVEVAFGSPRHDARSGALGVGGCSRSESECCRS